ncbi:MAG: biotin--[acetyl-CoA-carboxylase] ligase [Desulfonatronovibrio sp.]
MQFFIRIMCDYNKIYYLEELLPLKFSGAPGKPGLSGFFEKSPDTSRVFVYDDCTSSLDMAWKLISEKQLNTGDSALCLSQTRGRGRMGRQWSTCRGNLMAAWRIPGPGSRICSNLLPLIMGYCFRQAFLNLGLSLLIKWPNDLIFDNKKVGGILIEEKHDKLVAGIGINLAGSPRKSQMREQSPAQPGHIGPYLPDTDPVRLWAKLVSRAHFWYQDILNDFSVIDFMREINSNIWLLGENVRVHSSGEIVHGILMGIDHEGHLVIEGPSETVHVSDGTVSRGST